MTTSISLSALHATVASNVPSGSEILVSLSGAPRTFGTMLPGAMIPAGAGQLLGGTATAGQATTLSLSAEFTISGSTISMLSLSPAKIAQNGATTGQVLSWNGMAWAPTTIAEVSGGVSSFNARTGAVILGSADVTAALGTGSAAVTALGLGPAAAMAVGTVAGTVAAGNDSRIVGALQATAIPGTAGALLGGSGTPGAATAITVGSNLSLSSGTLSVVLPTATTSALGVVKPDGVSITINSSGVISSVGGGGGGSGSVATGTIGALAYYAAAGTTVGPLTLGTGLSISSATLNVALPAASTTTPAANGTAAVGTSSAYARADHVHPIDTSRLAAANNLSDVASASSARTNLGLGALAILSTLPAASIQQGGATVGQVLAWSGTAWAPGNPGAASGVEVDGSTIVASAGSPYQIPAGTFFVDVNKTTGAPTAVTLPSAPLLWTPYYVIDGKGDAASNNITVSVPSGATLTGGTTGTTFVMNAAYDAITFVAVNATTWRAV